MTIFFDTIIIIFLIIDALLVFNLAHQILHLLKTKNKMKLGGAILFLIIAICAGVLVFYGSFIEPRRIIVTNKNLVLNSEGNENFKIAFVTDFHTGAYISKGFIDKVAAKIREMEPDLVLVGGDFVSFGKNRNVDYLKSIGEIDAQFGVYGILGNHDYGPQVEELKTSLEDLGIDILKNENIIIQKNESRLAVLGLDDLWFGNIDFDAAEAGLPDGIYKILLEHNPDIVLGLRDRKYDAILAGHTHGGQIRLPFIGPLAIVPTALGRAYDSGEFNWQGTPLFITQGVGETGPRARLFTPPEIMVINVVF